MNPTGSDGPRTSGVRRRLSASVAGVVALMSGSVVIGPAHAAAVPERQALIILTGVHIARSAPSVHASVVAVVAARRPLTRVATVLPELGRTTGSGRSWVRVALPGRPNEGEGWIRAGRSRRLSTPWWLSVDLSTRRVSVFRFGRLVHRFHAVVGARATPTPRGRYFVEEALALDPSSPGAPFALASSARSDVYQEFDGGPGQIALHGRGGLPEALGTASSHGCVRLSDRAIRWLARRIGAGVPLTIRR